MADEKVYKLPTIDDQPFPQQDEGSTVNVTSPGTKDVKNTSQITNKSFPFKNVATELIGTALNTKSKKILQEFSLTESGALQIGKYVYGVSGDIRITPEGIVMRDKNGLTTVAQYAEDGSAVFKGTVQAGSLIGGGNKVVIDDDNGNGRIIVLNDDNIPTILIGYQNQGF